MTIVEVIGSFAVPCVVAILLVTIGPDQRIIYTLINYMAILY